MFFFRLHITFALLLLVTRSWGQSYNVDQVLTSRDLPFREVIASFETDDNIIWMVLPTSICRNTGSDIECFDYQLQGAEAAFLVDNQYIVVHNYIKSTLGYFDIKTRSFFPINPGGKMQLVQDINIQPQLFLTDHSAIYKFDFSIQKLIKSTLPNHFKHFFPSRCFTDGVRQSFQIVKYKMYFNGVAISVPTNINPEFYQIKKWQNQTIINTGKDIFRWEESSKSHKILYSDHRLCKKVYLDTKGNVIINLTKAEICKYSEELLLTDIAFKSFKPLKEFHTISALDSTLEHMGGRDFKHEILVSSYHGFASLKAEPKPISKLLDIELKEGFGTIIKGITTDSKGNAYFSNETNFIYRQNQSGRIDSFKIVIPYKDSLVKYHFSRNVYVDPKTDLLWGICGSYVKSEMLLFALEPATKKIKYSQSFPHRIWSFIPKNRQLLLSSSADLIFKFDLDTKRLDTLCSLPLADKPESRVLYNTDTKLFIGGKGGVYTYDWSSKMVKKCPGLDSAQVYCLAHAQTKLYVGSLDGFWIYDMLTQKVIKKYDKANGLSDNYITAISSISNDKIIVATFKGLNYIDHKKGLITTYYIKDGISDNEFNFIGYHSTPTTDYFGSINGVTVIKKSLFNTTNQATTKISKSTTFSFDDSPKTTFDGQEIVFGPNDQKIIVFLRNDSCQYNVRFAYRITGKDTTFHPIVGNSIELLRPINRKQEIEFICTNNLGIWSEKSTKFSIFTQNHFYKSAWFYSFITLLIGLGIYLLSRWRIAEIKKNEMAITEMNKKMAEQKLIALQSQMNPHFLFNTMSSLQYLIQTKKTVEADNLLSSFGILMRMILESSKTKFWSLGEEIKMIKLYCELEKQRFDDGKISVSIDDEDILSKEVSIPPMIIQPFIENVFNHAFVGTKNIAKLSIVFREDADHLTVTIIDNGIGIKKSEAIKSELQLLKKSRGLEITNERIENYNHEQQSKISYTIENATSDSSNPGTCVRILFNK